MLTCAAKAPGCRPGLGAIVPADGTPAAGGWSRIFLPGESGKAPRDGGGCEKNAHICFESLVSRSRGDSPATRREQAMHDVWILRVWIIPTNTGGMNFCHFPFWQKFPSTFGIYDTTGKEHQQLGKKPSFWSFDVSFALLIATLFDKEHVWQRDIWVWLKKAIIINESACGASWS